MTSRKNQPQKPWSCLSATILRGSRRNSTSPIIAKSHEARELCTCWLAFPGCDFEVLISNEVAVAFRRKGVVVCVEGIEHRDVADYDAYHTVTEEAYSKMKREPFNAALLDNLIVALRGVTTGGDVVGDSAHFVGIISDAITKLGELGESSKEDIDVMKQALVKMRASLFGKLMSKDMRRG